MRKYNQIMPNNNKIFKKYLQFMFKYNLNMNLNFEFIKYFLALLLNKFTFTFTFKSKFEFIFQLIFQLIFSNNVIHNNLWQDHILVQQEKGKIDFFLTSFGASVRVKDLAETAKKEDISSLEWMGGMDERKLKKLVVKKINVLTIIPGYIRTRAFDKDKWNAPSFLIASPKKSAQIIYKAIKSKKDIVYLSFIWRIIVFCILCIPEKIFKKFKF